MPLDNYYLEVSGKCDLTQEFTLSVEIYEEGNFIFQTQGVGMFTKDLKWITSFTATDIQNGLYADLTSLLTQGVISLNKTYLTKIYLGNGFNDLILSYLFYTGNFSEQGNIPWC